MAPNENAPAAGTVGADERRLLGGTAQEDFSPADAWLPEIPDDHPAARGMDSGEPEPAKERPPQTRLTGEVLDGAELTPALKRVDLTCFEHRVSAGVEFVLEPALLAREATLLSGHGGTGKTLLALILLAHIAVGRSWATYQCSEPRRVLFVSLEDTASMVLARLKRICRHYRLPPDLIRQNLSILDGSEGDAVLMVPDPMGQRGKLVETASMKELAAFVSEGYALVCVDNASDAFDGDENAKREVRRFVRSLIRMARKGGAGVLLLAHVDKHAVRFGGKGQAFSGSVAWHNSARSRLALITDESGVLQLHQEKLQEGARKADPITLGWTDDGVLIPMDPADAQAEAEAVRALTDGADDDGVFAAIRNACEVGVTVPGALSGQDTALHFLRAAPEVPAALKQDNRASNQRLRAALQRLQRSGRLTVETYRDSSRNSRKKLVAAPPAGGSA